MAAVAFDCIHVIAVRLNKCKPSDTSFCIDRIKMNEALL